MDHFDLYRHFPYVHLSLFEFDTGANNLAVVESTNRKRVAVLDYSYGLAASLTEKQNLVDEVGEVKDMSVLYLPPQKQMPYERDSGEDTFQRSHHLHHFQNHRSLHPYSHRFRDHQSKKAMETKQVLIHDFPASLHPEIPLYQHHHVPKMTEVLHHHQS